MTDQPAPAPTDTLRQRIAEAVYGALPPRPHNRLITSDVVDAVLAVVQPELRIASALHRSAETNVNCVIELANRWRQLPNRQNAYRELVAALDGQSPAPDAGPTVREAADHDRQWPLQKHGE